MELKVADTILYVAPVKTSMPFVAAHPITRPKPVRRPNGKLFRFQTKQK